MMKIIIQRPAPVSVAFHRHCSGVGALAVRYNSSVSNKTKILIALCVAALLAIVVPNFIKARHATAHNSAIDNLRQFSTNTTVSSNSAPPSQ
jgi:hypothetical protein